MKKVVLVVLISVVSIFSSAIIQETLAAHSEAMKSSGGILSTPTECKKLSDQFVQLVANGKTAQAFDLIKPFWPMPENEMATLQMQTTTQLNTVGPRFGGVVGHQYISEEKVSDFIIRYTYVVKYQKHIIRWVFIFYKPDNTWLVNVVKFDDNIKALFQ